MQTWDENGVRQERTGWRCQKISNRHREWGYNCPAVDLDFVMAEYNYGMPVALIEYKERSARDPDLSHATYQALTALADGYSGGALPFLVAFYDTECWSFRVLPVNERARAFYRHVDRIWISEQRFVRSLYLLRKEVLSAKDEDAISRLNSFALESAEAA